MAKTSAWFLLAATVVLSVCGQLLLKWQGSRAGASPGDPRGLLMLIARLLFNPWIIAGLGAAFLASLLWMLALTKLDLSEA